MTNENRDARFLAALAFLSLVVPAWGGLISLIIYLAERRQLPYAAFHAAQATVIHAVALLSFLGVGSAFAIAALFAELGSKAQWVTAAFAASVAILGLCVVVGIGGAILAWTSGFRFPGIARLVGSS